MCFSASGNTAPDLVSLRCCEHWQCFTRAIAGIAVVALLKSGSTAQYTIYLQRIHNSWLEILVGLI